MPSANAARRAFLPRVREICRNDLKSVDVDTVHDALIVIISPPGSEKSSLLLEVDARASEQSFLHRPG